MAPPTLAVARRRKQAVNYFLEGVRRFVVQELLDLCRSRRQSGEIERGASQQCRFVRGRRRLQFMLLKVAEDKTVDWIRRPVLGGDLGRSRASQRAESPIIAIDIGNLAPQSSRS